MIVFAQRKRDPAAGPWPQRRNAGALHRCGPPSRPDNLASSAAPDPDERTPRELRRSFVPPPSGAGVPIEQISRSSQRLFADMSVSVTRRRSWRGHRGPQGTLDGIADLIAGFTAGSIALAVTSCDHMATRSRPTSKSRLCRRRHNHDYADTCLMPTSGRSACSTVVSGLKMSA
jgi:hypothetical protein